MESDTDLKDEDLKDYCPNCGAVDYPVMRKSGSTVVEVLLWLFLLVPGVIYSIWRAASKRLVCPQCEHDGTIPADSPIAQAALANLSSKSNPNVAAPNAVGSR